MEIKEAIEVLKERSEWIKKHFPESSHAKAIDTVVAELEKPIYTPADMEAFAEWASNEGWQYLWYYKCWQNNTSIYQKTTAKLIGMWEESKGKCSKFEIN